jgi:hypothetical protein
MLVKLSAITVTPDGENVLVMLRGGYGYVTRIVSVGELHIDTRNAAGIHRPINLGNIADVYRFDKVDSEFPLATEIELEITS